MSTLFPQVPKVQAPQAPQIPVLPRPAHPCFSVLEQNGPFPSRSSPSLGAWTHGQVITVRALRAWLQGEQGS